MGSSFHAIVELDKELDGAGNVDVSTSVYLLPKYLGADDVVPAPLVDAEGIFYLLDESKGGEHTPVGTYLPWYGGSSDSAKNFYVEETRKVTGWSESDIQAVLSAVDNIIYEAESE